MSCEGAENRLRFAGCSLGGKRLDMETLVTIAYIALCVALFSLAIFIHELGHFLAARACGVAIREFAVGMGPKLFSWQSKKYDTQYALRLLPIGGYVSMVGEDDDSDDENAFHRKNVWQKMAIIVAGPLMNIVLAITSAFFALSTKCQKVCGKVCILKMTTVVCPFCLEITLR